jgi:hypothetical protein
MQRMALVTWSALILVIACGCDNSRRGAYKGETVDAFNGRVTAGGQPVNFPSDERIVLRIYHQGSAQMWGIPLQADGTFKIGWMPTGKYTSVLERASKSSKGGRTNLQPIPGTFDIVQGQTEYTIDLGKGFKP